MNSKRGAIFISGVLIFTSAAIKLLTALRIDPVDSENARSGIFEAPRIFLHVINRNSIGLMSRWKLDDCPLSNPM